MKRKLYRRHIFNWRFTLFITTISWFRLSRKGSIWKERRRDSHGDSDCGMDNPGEASSGGATKRASARAGTDGSGSLGCRLKCCTLQNSSAIDHHLAELSHGKMR